jgi:sugar phosphate isomerase/epimerase
MTDLLATCWTHTGGSFPYPGSDVSPLTLRERAEASAAAGFRGYGITLQDLDVALETTTLPALRSMFDGLGLTSVELEFLGDWWETGNKRTASDRDRKKLLDAAEALGAMHIKIGGYVARDGEGSPDLDIARLAPDLHHLAVEAADRGTRVAIEFLPMSDVSTVLEALELCETADHPAAGICLDVWHIERGDSAIDDIRALPAERIFAVELDDAPASMQGENLYQDTMHFRRFPGDGDFDLDGFVAAVRATGYDGPWGVEILSAAQRERSIADTLADAYRTAKAYLD